MALSANAANQNATTSRILNKLNYAVANIADDIGTASTSDIVLMADASDNYEIKYADADNVKEMIAVRRVETVTATNVITAAESGTTYFLDAAAGFTSTLPAPAAGLEYTFIVKTAPTSNGYIIASNGGGDVIVLGVNELEVDTGDDGPYDDNADAVTFVANVAVAGDRCYFICDGTKWYGFGQTNADGGITTATT